MKGLEAIQKELAAPFAEKDLEWRVMRSGITGERPWARVIAYVTSRAIMDRLDDVAGPGNWRNEFKPFDTIASGGVASRSVGAQLCGISIRDDERSGEWVTKWDGAENTDIEPVKGGISGAMKRAAVLWGIGRYLYRLEEGFATISDRGAFRDRVKDESGKYVSFSWDPPPLPAWAVPTKPTKPGAKGPAPDPDNAPCKAPDQDQATDEGLGRSQTQGQTKDHCQAQEPTQGPAPAPLATPGEVVYICRRFKELAELSRRGIRAQLLRACRLDFLTWLFGKRLESSKELHADQIKFLIDYMTKTPNKVTGFVINWKVPKMDA